MRDDLAVLPLVAVGDLAVEGLAELGPDGDRGADPLGDLLPFPLGHRGDHGVEEPACGGGGVDRFLERHQVCSDRTENIGELQKLLGVPCQPGQLGEDQAGDLPRPDVGQHPLGFGVFHHRLAADGFQPVDLRHPPAAALGVVAGSLLVVLGALALDLVFGRNADPDPDCLGGGGWRAGGINHGDYLR